MIPFVLQKSGFTPVPPLASRDRLFTVNDVKIGGSKYGIINLQGLKAPTFEVQMHENLYFTNRKVRPVPTLVASCLWA